MEKGIYVKDIIPNADINGIFVIGWAELAQSRNGPFWKLRLADSSGEVDAKIWSPLSQRFIDIRPGTFVRIFGKTSVFRDQTQVILHNMVLLSEDECSRLDKRDLMPSSPYDPEDMFRELTSHCGREFTYAPWRKFVSEVFSDTSVCRDFKTFPAAKKMHHAYAGGLLEHSLSVFKLCKLLCDHYPNLDRQSLLAGAIFHDIGKIREFSGGFANDYTDEGNLLGHSYLGLQLLSPFMEASGLDEPLKAHLTHLILSHHGEPEFGAARLPQTPEAFALHYADNLDAKMAQCRQALAGAAGGTWSCWQNSLNRQLYRPMPTPDQQNAIHNPKGIG